MFFLFLCKSGKRFRLEFQPGGATSLVPFMSCMSAKSSTASKSKSTGAVHAWDVVLKFYQLKGGQEYNSQPQRKLSASFGLDLAGSASNNKQSLLSTIGQILTSHGLYKRSPDAHFKAFICAALK